MAMNIPATLAMELTMPLLKGFDVSAYQTTSVPDGSFIFVKATEGRSYTSSRFGAQWANAKAKGMIRGAYHFARPEQSPAKSQADRFLSAVKAAKGEMLCLDLESSGLNQAETNAWARSFGDRLREQAPGVTTVIYMGSGYARSNTGKDLKGHFDWWWYPQYPSSASTTRWPSSFSPWLPPGLTIGWDLPHIWQWTSNYSGKFDANVSWLTSAQLRDGSQSIPGWTQALVAKLPQLGKGASGEDVRTLQGLLRARSHSEVKVDGQFGMVTEKAVKAVQNWGGVTADGSVAQRTWAVLLRVHAPRARS